MKRSLIVAVAENGVIGKNNDLVWHLPDDMKFFKQKTLNHHIIMGRKNYESIPEKYRPFSNRTNMVLSRNEQYQAPGCLLFNDIQHALQYAENNGEQEAFIIGGAKVYQEALNKNLVDVIYYTHIFASFDGDAFFPQVDWQQWRLTETVFHQADEKHNCAFEFRTFLKK